MCGYAFEFVAGKSLPAFFGALSRVAEGLRRGSGNVPCHHSPNETGKLSGNVCLGNIDRFRSQGNVNIFSAQPFACSVRIGNDFRFVAVLPFL